ncbi:protein spaetzle 3-like [Penaeus monodon]|uniref:protein spaetzle 3-like n=1 Tax=Penaeus monodon TaxID=6687 RepID=UPI0018A7DF7E|nr:protein spaetzle 3-like [Penaeus monodon]
MALTLSVILACAGLVLGSVHPPAYGHHPQPSYGHHAPAYSHHAPAYGHHAPAYAHQHTYDHGYCDPTVAPACAANSTLSYCLEDTEYPEYEIKAAITADHLFAKKYADVADQSADDLVDMLTKDQEEAFDYSYYTGASTGDSPYDATHWAGPEGYICPSEVVYAMPKRAQNVDGKWRVIVNDIHYYSQTARLETCLFPEAACRALAPCYQSHCTQKSVYHRLLSYDPCDPYKGLFIDIYKMPSACSCHLPA